MGFVVLSSFVLGGVTFSSERIFAAKSFFQVDIDAPAQVDRKVVTQLQKLKTSERAGDAKACLKAAKGLSPKSGVTVWIERSLLNCLVQAELRQAGTVGEALYNQLLKIHQRGAGLIHPSAGSSLGDLVEQGRLLWLRNYALKNPVKANELIGQLLSSAGASQKSLRAEALLWSARLAAEAKHLQEASVLYEQSLAENSTDEAVKEYAQLLLKLNFPTMEKKTNGEKTPVVAEGDFENRFKSSLQARDQLNLLEDVVAYLNAYPNGAKSKWASEKGMEILQNLVSQSLRTGETAVAIGLRDRAFGVTQKLDFVRQGEWARILHRRGDWLSSLRLAEQALVRLEGTQSAGTLLYVAGRSAQFVGDYSKSRTHFERYMNFHSGGEDLPEVIFRLGLNLLRQKEFGAAAATFEKLLAPNATSRYDLWAWHWFIRALQASQNERAKEEVQKLLRKYPFSYYGIRLQSELSKGSWDWPQAQANGGDSGKNKIKPWILSSAHFAIWKRFQILREAGWADEALIEIEALPQAKDPLLKAQLARAFAQAEAYPVAIRFLNQAGDESEELRSREWVAVGFPKYREKIIEAEAKKQGLDPLILLSLIRQESAFNAGAISTSNALGLMQIIPPTAREIAQDLNLRNIEIPRSLFLPEINIQMGSYYLGKLVREFNSSVPMALAGYNAGPHRLKTFFRSRTSDLQTLKLSSDHFTELWIDELPWFETSFYVKAIVRNFMIYRSLDEGRVDVQKIIEQGLVLSPKSSAQNKAPASIR